MRGAPRSPAPCLPPRRPGRTFEAMPDKEELYDQGLDLAFDGDFRGAIERYRAALEVDPEYIDAVHALAMAYKELATLKAKAAGGQ